MSEQPTTCDPCHAQIDPREQHMRHRVTGALLCMTCANKMTLHTPRDWEKKGCK